MPSYSRVICSDEQRRRPYPGLWETARALGAGSAPGHPLACRAMGQLVGVVEKKSANPGLVRFELNRNLTGSGHERFGAGAEAVGDRPSAELARRLFGTGQVTGVHLYMNVVTVDLAKG